MRHLVSKLAIVGLTLGPSIQVFPTYARSKARPLVEVVATASPAVSATVLTLQPVVKSKEPPVPGITAGSSAVHVGNWLFIAQDDSTMLVARADDGRLESIRLFPSIDGADRFLDAFKNKKVKPDVEAAVAVRVPASTATRFGVAVPARARSVDAVIAFGSGSKAPTRDRFALVFPSDPLDRTHVVTVQADAFYARLRSVPAMTGSGGTLNVEGVTSVGGGRALRFYNRGNGGPGSVDGSVDVNLGALLDYALRAKKDAAATFDAKVDNPRRYKLGASADGFPLAITDAAAVRVLHGAPRGSRGEMRILSSVVEHIASAVDDGFTSDASLALELPDGRVLVAPIKGVPNASALKIEGISVTSAEWTGSPARLSVHLVGVVDPDATDPSVPSSLATLELVYTPSLDR